MEKGSLGAESLDSQQFPCFAGIRLLSINSQASSYSSSARYEMWVEQGIDEEEAAVLALDSVNNDLLHHGELRGVEVKLIDIQYTETTEGIEISFNLGVSDDDARLEVDYSFILE